MQFIQPIRIGSTQIVKKPNLEMKRYHINNNNNTKVIKIIIIIILLLIIIITIIIINYSD